MRKAFTLTELMIALAIIGIVSAMVVPVFVNSYSNKVLGTQLKKICTQITMAAKDVMNDERAQDLIEKDEIFDQEDVDQGAEQDPEQEPQDPNSQTENSETSETEEENTNQGGFYMSSAAVKTSGPNSGAEYFLNKYFTHVKVNCSSDGASSCVAEQYKSPKKANLGTIPSGFYCIKTTNSAAICMKNEDDVMKVIVDINGVNKPNMAGVDTFVMYITNDGSLKDLDEDASHCNQGGTTILENASGCFSKIVNNGWIMPKD